MVRINGTPWHTTTLGDGERHYRTVCKYYDMLSKRCSIQVGSCIGPSRCRDFKRMTDNEIRQRNKKLKEVGYQGKAKHPKHHEDFWFLHEDIKNEIEAKNSKKQETKVVRKTAKKYEDVTLPKEYVIGAHVYVDKYKKGVIIAIDKRSIFIQFDNGTTKWFVYPQCKEAVKLL